MDFPHEVTVKQERDLEGTEVENNNDNYMKRHFEVHVKVEDDEDWCLQSPGVQTFEDYQVYEVVKEESVYYACLLCYEEFLDSFSLYHHNLSHLRVLLDQPRNLFQCDYCLCYYTCKTKLEHHIHSKHVIKNKMLTSNSFRQCHICQEVLKVKNWQSHMKEAHGVNKLKCAACDVTFKSVEYFRRHLLHTHEKVRPSWRFHSVKEQEFKCDLCPAVFHNKTSKTTHIRNCHSTAHECPICKSTLKSKPYLLTHLKRVHYNDGKVHRCDICKKKFKSPRYVRVHKKNAHGVKPKGKVRNVS